MFDEAIDLGSDVGSDIGSAISGDYEGDFGGDLASDEGVDLSGDVNTDMGGNEVDSLNNSDDIGEDLNNDATAINDVDTDAETDNRFHDGAKRVGAGLGAVGAATAGALGALPPEDMSGRGYPTDIPAIYQEAPHHIAAMHNNPVEDNLHEQFPEYSFSIPGEDDVGLSRRDAARQLGRDITDAGRAWVDVHKDTNERND